MPPEYRKIVDEIYTALENLNAPPLLLGIVGSWGDTENAPNLQRAECSSTTADGRMATVATRQRKSLDSDRPSHGRR
jgi:hypothetical protein